MAALLVYSFFVAALLAAVVVFRHFAPLVRRNPGVPRGSFGWPLVGETLGFLRPHASTTTGAFLRGHTARYGTVFRSHLFGAPTVVSCDAGLNHLVLQNEERLFRCSYPGPVRGILGDSSLLVVTGDRHRRLRGVALVFAASAGPRRPGYHADVGRAARAAVASWRGRAVAFCGEARQVLGLSPDEPVAGRILEDYSTFMKGLVSLPVNIPGTPYARAVEARRKISITLEGIMEDRRKGDGSFKKAAFLDVLLANSDLNQTAGKKFAPFGGGLRLCPGSELGKVEAAFFLHHLVLSYRWRLDGEDVPMAHQYVEFRRGLP